MAASHAEVAPRSPLPTPSTELDALLSRARTLREDAYLLGKKSAQQRITELEHIVAQDKVTHQGQVDKLESELKTVERRCSHLTRTLGIIEGFGIVAFDSSAARNGGVSPHVHPTVLQAMKSLADDHGCGTDELTPSTFSQCIQSIARATTSSHVKWKALNEALAGAEDKLASQSKAFEVERLSWRHRLTKAVASLEEQSNLHQQTSRSLEQERQLVHSLKYDVSSLTREKEATQMSSESTLRQLRSQLSTALLELEHSRDLAARHAALEKAHTDLVSSHALLSSRIAEGEAARRAAEFEYQESVAQLQTLLQREHEQLESSQKTVGALTSQVRVARQELGTANLENSQQRAAIDDLNLSLRLITEKKDAASQLNSHLIAEAKDRNALAFDLQRQNATLRSDLQAARSQYSKAQEEVSRISAQLSFQVQETHTLREAVETKYMESVEEHHKTVDQLQSQLQRQLELLESSQRDAWALTSQVQEARKELEGSKLENSIQRATLEDLDHSLRIAMEEKDTISQSVSRLTAEIEKQSTVVSDLQQQNATIHNDLRSSQTSHSQAQAELSRMNAEYASLQQANASLRQCLDETKMGARALFRARAVACLRLSDEQESHRREIEVLQQRLAVADKSLQRQKQATASVEKKCASSKADIALLQSRLSSRDELLAQQTNRIHELEAQELSLRETLTSNDQMIGKLTQQLEADRATPTVEETNPSRRNSSHMPSHKRKTSPEVIVVDDSDSESCCSPQLSNMPRKETESPKSSVVSIQRPTRRDSLRKKHTKDSSSPCARSPVVNPSPPSPQLPEPSSRPKKRCREDDPPLPKLPKRVRKPSRLAAEIMAMKSPSKSGSTSSKRKRIS